MKTRYYYTSIDTPVGVLTLRGSERGISGLYSERQLTASDKGALGELDEDPLVDAKRQIEAYFAGKLTDFSLDLDLVGTPFQTAVWAALRTIPYGETVSYARIADLIGRKTAVRAVGAAIGKNPVMIVVPCHRVIGSNGSLTGFAGGLECKRRLLNLEKSALEQAVTKIPQDSGLGLEIGS